MEENNVNNTAAPAGKNGKVKEKIASETGNVMDKVKDELNKSGAMDQLKELTDTTQAH